MSMWKHCRDCVVEDCSVRIVDDVICDHYIEKPQTNFDRLQAMSINEFATWLTDFCCATVGNAADARVAMYHCGLREWLEQEATK